MRIVLTCAILLSIEALAVGQTPSAAKTASWAAKTERTVSGPESDPLHAMVGCPTGVPALAPHEVGQVAQESRLGPDDAFRNRLLGGG